MHASGGRRSPSGGGRADGPDAGQVCASRAGTVRISERHLLNERAPFGSYRQSGIGRDFGADDLKQCAEAKHLDVDEADVRDTKPWYDVVVPRD